LEHHVFEEMGKASAIFGFDPKSYTVINGDYDGWRRRILGKHDTQPVREFVIAHRHREAVLLGGLAIQESG